MAGNSRKNWRILVISLALVLVGSLLGGWIHAGAGTIDVKDIRYAGTNGFVYNARLYVPKGVTNENPAPGVVVVHGGDAQNEIIANVALELGRRGFVALSIDQPGAGFSDPPSFSMGMGGPDALAYLRSLDIVDTDNIGLVGMSMGGDALGHAAKTYPDGYQAMAFLDTRCNLGPGMACDFPVRNAMVTWGLLEEHPTFFWGVEKSKDVPDSEALQYLFNVTERVEPGKLYGSVEIGTAHRLHLTNDTHLSSLDSKAAIGNVIEWFQLTLEGGSDLPPARQIWPWKVVGTFTAFVGLAMFLFPMGALLLQTSFFQSLGEEVPVYQGLTGHLWWIGAVITTILAPATYVWSRNHVGGAKLLLPGSLWPQSQTNRYYLGWAFVLGLILVILILLNHYAYARRKGASAFNYGLTWQGRGLDWTKIGKSLLLATCILVPAYLILSIAYTVLKIDFRLNFLALRPMSPLRFQAFLGYMIPFVLLYLLLGVMLHGFLRWKEGQKTMGQEMLANVLMLIVGVVVWMVIQYASLYATGAPIMGTDTNLTIRATPLLVIFPLIALLSTYYFRKTGHIYVGGFLNGLFITWYLAANSMMSVVP
jgi:pimeloyl-ACP methyl ester carboxylesterase